MGVEFEEQNWAGRTKVRGSLPGRNWVLLINIFICDELYDYRYKVS